MLELDSKTYFVVYTDYKDVTRLELLPTTNHSDLGVILATFIGGFLNKPKAIQAVMSGPFLELAWANIIAEYPDIKFDSHVQKLVYKQFDRPDRRPT